MGCSHWHGRCRRRFFERFELDLDRMRNLGLRLNRFNGFAENFNGWGNHFRGFGLNPRRQNDFTNRARLVGQNLNRLC
jgi:hypothetical protein